MTCPHNDVEIIEAIPLEGEVYGEMYGQCRSCLCYVKAYGHIESEPRTLERQSEWEIDQDAMQEACQ